jgi:hypothetical protein
MTKIAIYTAVFGEFDPLRDPLFKSPGCDYICFTDSQVESDGWKIIQTEVENPADQDTFKTPQRFTSRKHKLLPHRFLPEYDYWVWMDGNITTKGDIRPLVTAVEYLASFEHRTLGNTYEEGLTCIASNKDSYDRILPQLKKYDKVGLNQTRHFESGVNIRKNCQRVVDFNELWWLEVKNHSIRDQISLAYSLGQVELPCQTLPGDLDNNDYFLMLAVHLNQEGVER